MDGKNQILDNIRSRRSFRKFKEQAVPRRVADSIIEAGAFAPSALNRQPWKFLAIDDKEFIRELSTIATKRLKRLYRLIPILKLFVRYLRDERVAAAIKKTAEGAGDTVFYNAPLLIFVANDARLKESKEDCYLAAQNMMLAAHSLGVGSCFIGRGKAIPKGILQKRFNLPSFYDIHVYIAFGYPQEPFRTAPPRSEDSVKWA